MAAPIYRGGRPYLNVGQRFGPSANQVIIPLLGSGAPTNGGAGTGAGFAGIGSMYIDYAAGVLYLNTGTKASPTWTAGGSTAGAITPSSVTSSGKISSTSPTAGVGYSTGAGGAVTQATNKSTGVTLNTVTGAITLNNAAMADSTPVSFTVTNSAVAATDAVIVNHASAGTAGAYLVSANAIGAGSFKITVQNISGGSLSEAIVLRFAVIKGVSA